MNFKVVYDPKHLFGLGPIPKQRIGRNFWQIPKLTKTVKSEIGKRYIKGSVKFFHVISIPKTFIWYTTNKLFINTNKPM